MAIADQTQLGLKLVGDITGRFLVPDYQRGFRWGDEQVGLLLQDIWDNQDNDYCLQPVVVKRRPELDGRVELIDGQQRLTTLYLIFFYLRHQHLPSIDLPFTLEYETRPGSAEYLMKLDATLKESNVDFLHIYRAFERIQEWFDAHGNRRQHVALKFHGLLYDRVKVIWYEANRTVDARALFTRLNVGRIPLTNAELIKALLLRQDPTTANPHRQIEIASQWDLIERDLHDQSFWAFLANRDQVYPTRIELLFDMMAGTVVEHERFQTFYYFKRELDALRGAGDKDPAATLWSRILERYYLLKEWHEDRDLYHRVGYLVAIGENLASLVGQSASLTKSQFHNVVNDRMRESLRRNKDEIEELTYTQWDACFRVLLLFNVESMRILSASSDRYPFHEHKRRQWTLEHIHAQNAEELNKKEDWQNWLGEHRMALKTILREEGVRESQRLMLMERIDASFNEVTRESFAILAPDVAAFFDSAGEEGVHSIANLALLPGDINSALSNSVFEVKRRMILEMDRSGAYIPICTRRVFLKYYTNGGGHQIHMWSPQDRASYLEAMLDAKRGVLRDYLAHTTGAAV